MNYKVMGLSRKRFEGILGLVTFLKQVVWAQFAMYKKEAIILSLSRMPRHQLHGQMYNNTVIRILKNGIVMNVSHFYGCHIQI